MNPHTRQKKPKQPNKKTQPVKDISGLNVVFHKPRKSENRNDNVCASQRQAGIPPPAILPEKCK